MHTNPAYSYIEKTIFAYIVLERSINKISEFIEVYDKIIKNLDCSYLAKHGIEFKPKTKINQSYVSRHFDKYGIHKEIDSITKKKRYTIKNENYVMILSSLKDKLKNISIIPHQLIEIDADVYGIESESERDGLYILPLSVTPNTERYVSKVLYNELSINKSHLFTSIMPGICSVLILTKYKWNAVTLNELFLRLSGHNSVQFEGDICENFENSIDCADYMLDDLAVPVIEALGMSWFQQSNS